MFRTCPPRRAERRHGPLAVRAPAGQLPVVERLNADADPVEPLQRRRVSRKRPTPASSVTSAPSARPNVRRNSPTHAPPAQRGVLPEIDGVEPGTPGGADLAAEGIAWGARCSILEKLLKSHSRTSPRKRDVMQAERGAAGAHGALLPSLSPKGFLRTSTDPICLCASCPFCFQQLLRCRCRSIGDDVLAQAHVSAAMILCPIAA